jgi:hypothetical protein
MALKKQGSLTSVGHGQVSRGFVLDLEVLIVKLAAVDGLATSSYETLS